MSGEVCWGVEEVRREVWGKVRGDVGCVKNCGGMCGRVYGLSVENVGKCVGVGEVERRCGKRLWK